MIRSVAGAVLVAALASGGTSACTSTTTPTEPESCANGEGHWIEDDNGMWEDTTVTVRLCLSENGQVLDMEVN